MFPHRLVIPSLIDLQNKLSKYIVGQAELIDAVTMTIYKHLYKVIGVHTGKLEPTSTNLLITGSTGTGKTYTVKQLAKILGIPFIEINGPSVSQEGWKGHSLKDFIAQGMQKYQNIESRSYPIIYIDEFDKLCAPQGASNSINYSVHVQASILKYIEGMVLEINNVSYDTGLFCFIFSGTFNELGYQSIDPIGFMAENMAENYQYQLEQFGVLPEIIGRVNRIIRTNDFTSEMYRDLICNPMSSFNQWFTFFRSVGIDRENEPNWTHIIDQAIKSGLGARALNNLIEPEIDRCIKNGDLQKVWNNYLAPGPTTLTFLKPPYEE